MKTISFTKVELLSLLVSAVVGLFPGNWTIPRTIVFFTALALTVVVVCLHLITSKAGNRKGGTLRKQYLDEFTLGLIRNFRNEMSQFGDEVGDETRIHDIFQRYLQQIHTNIQEVCAIEEITVSSGLNSIIHLDLLATKRGLEAVEKAVHDEFNDYCPHSYIHPVKRPIRIREFTTNLLRIMKTI